MPLHNSRTLALDLCIKGRRKYSYLFVQDLENYVVWILRKDGVYWVSSACSKERQKTTLRLRIEEKRSKCDTMVTFKCEILNFWGKIKLCSENTLVNCF